jgi:hypothetical protein
VTVRTKDGETEKEFSILVGPEDPQKKQVVLKNPALDYLFRVDSSLLSELPKEAKDWMPAAPEKEPEKEKEEKK